MSSEETISDEEFAKIVNISCGNSHFSYAFDSMQDAKDAYADAIAAVLDQFTHPAGYVDEAAGLSNTEMFGSMLLDPKTVDAIIDALDQQILDAFKDLHKKGDK